MENCILVINEFLVIKLVDAADFRKKKCETVKQLKCIYFLYDKLSVMYTSRRVINKNITLMSKPFYIR